MVPTKETIARLTYKQRDAIQKMQAEGIVIPAPGHEIRTYNHLVRIGIAGRRKIQSGKIAFRLFLAWRTVDVTKKKLAELRVERMAARKAAVVIQPGKKESPVIPDAHKIFQRPKANYGNPSWEERIAKIMSA